MEPWVYKMHEYPFTFRRFTHIPFLPNGMHEELEILYVRKGPVSMVVNRKDVVLNDGDVLFQPPFSYHEFHDSGEEPVSFDAVIFRPGISGLSSLLPAAFPVDPKISAEKTTPLMVELIEHVAALALAGKKKEGFLPEESEERFDFALKQSDTVGLGPYLTVLALECLSLVEMNPEENPDLSLLERILRYIADHFNEDISRDHVADACGVTPNTISEVFSDLGTSFREYLNARRIEEAYNLLTTTKKPVNEIMRASGYLNQGTFNKNFFARFGKTPREVRDSIKNG